MLFLSRTPALCTGCCLVNSSSCCSPQAALMLLEPVTAYDSGRLLLCVTQHVGKPFKGEAAPSFDIWQTLRIWDSECAPVGT